MEERGEATGGAATAPDRDTVDVYERLAAEWRDRRRPADLADAERLAQQVMGAAGADDDPEPSRIADLGCGPGWTLSALGPDAIGLDAARAMLEQARGAAPDRPLVQAALEALPLRRGALAGAWANRSYVHVARPRLPLALADLHRSLRPGAPVELVLFRGDQDLDPFAGDDFAGRRFSAWDPDRLREVLVGAGFLDATVQRRRPRRRGGDDRLVVHATRARTLPDTVGPAMRLLVVGLNPSRYAADRGVGFARPGNRFWPAALEAGVASVDRDPRHALLHHGTGMTDLVKRATVAADELTAEEYAAGAARLTRLAAWLRPAVVVVLGLTGWRAAVDRRAVAGPLPEGIGGRPAYLMPNPSGLNAHTSVPDLVEHLRRAQDLAAPPPPAP